MVLKPIVVILPGLDGTGLMLADFTSVLSAHCDVSIINYPPDRAMTYADLSEYVSQRLPAEPFVLIAESFSGPIALQLAGRHPPKLQCLVLVASFARVDLPWKSLLIRLLPWLSPKWLPMAMADWLLMNGTATWRQRQVLKTALSRVYPNVLRLRATEALRVDLTGAGMSSKCRLCICVPSKIGWYLQPRRQRLR